ncbi:MAG: hypothetical protein JWO78_903 [Micavibrio sp.]|nr:hypothetical protein [Micavibrio sp.]
MNLPVTDGQQEAFAASSGVQHPFAALARLSNAIQAIDRFIFSKTRGYLEVMTHRRLAYLRNTLAVSYDLWQGDAHSRVSRSRSDIYIFCMTDREKLAFQRRMVPALSFAAEGLRALEIEALSPVVDLVGNAALDAQNYVTENKAQIRAGTETADDQVWREFPPLTLPEIKA